MSDFYEKPTIPGISAFASEDKNGNQGTEHVTDAALAEMVGIDAGFVEVSGTVGSALVHAELDDRELVVA